MFLHAYWTAGPLTVISDKPMGTGWLKKGSSRWSFILRHRHIQRWRCKPLLFPLCQTSTWHKVAIPMLNSIQRGVLGIWHAPVLVHPLLCGQDKGSNVHQDYDGEEEAVGKAIGPLSIKRPWNHNNKNPADAQVAANPRRLSSSKHSVKNHLLSLILT